MFTQSVPDRAICGRPLTHLCRIADECLLEYLRATLDLPEGLPGIVMAIHTFGEYLDFRPHLQVLVADGLFFAGVSDPVAASSGRSGAAPARPEDALEPIALSARGRDRSRGSMKCNRVRVGTKWSDEV